jgi:signal transduction histidine kinase
MKLFHRFFVKLSLIFFSLLLILVTIQVFLSMRISEKRQVEIDQLLNHHLARDMAREIEPYLRDGLDIDRIESVMHYMMVMNPKIEIYLLDTRGKIIAYFMEPGLDIQTDYVKLDPILSFLQNNSPIPLYGTDPRNPGVEKHFSAAPINIGPEETGYLYIILRSSLYDRAAGMLRDHYLFSTLNKSLLLSLPFVALIGAILFFFLTKRLLKVSRAVRDFESGNYQSRIEINSKDEIGSLARAFNQMAATIQGHLEELKKTDELRRELVANVSHDLKSPLATIQGYIETLLMKRGTLTDREEQHFLEIVLKSTRSLDRLVGNLLELSKLDTKQVEPVLETFSMTDLAQDVFMKFKPLAERHGVRLSAHTDESLCFVKADIGLIERVMSNLMDNAVKHTPLKGSVRMDVKSDNGDVWFAVSDTGQGIPPEDIPRLFERFYIGKRRGSFHEGSVGLGLAIAQKIMQLHGSGIEVESHPDKGSIFSFHLPGVPAATA